MSAVPSQRSTFVAVALCAAAYLYVFPYQAPINNPNENVRLYMTAAIVEQGTYVIDDLRARWGWTNDAAIYEGHAYSVKAPATSFLGVPPYAAYYWWTEWRGTELDRTTALWLCRVFGSILPWLFFLFFFHRWLGQRTSSAAVRDAVFFSIAIGSCLYGYGMLFMSHTLSAAAAFGAFMLLESAQHAGRMRSARAFWAGFLAAGVTLLEYPGFVASALLCLYALYVVRPWIRIVPFGLGAIVPALAMMHFQWKCFGSPFSPGHLYVETPGLREPHHEGFYGAIGVSADALGGLLIHPGAGLFPLTPILVFAIVGAVIVIRKKRIEGIAALAIIVLMTLLISAMNNWRGGWTIGPRYLALLYPFFGWLALLGLEPLVKRWPSATAGIALGATAAGFVASGIPSAYYPHFPPEIDRPLTQIVRVLIEHDFAPYAALNLFGVYGTISMVPLAIVMLGCLVWMVSMVDGVRARVIAGVLGALLAVGITWPLQTDPRPGHPEIRNALGFITGVWDPAGHDLAARLEAQLRSRGDRDGYLRLAELYASEGRDRDALRARARAAAFRR